MNIEWVRRYCMSLPHATEALQERLDHELDIDLITTAPSVRYRVTTTSGEVNTIRTYERGFQATRSAGCE